MKKIRVAVRGGYDILIGKGLLNMAAEEIRQRFPKAKKIMLFSDDRVYGFYGEKVKKLLAQYFSVSVFVVPNGENAKCASNFIALMEELAQAGITGTDLLVALGGGVVGDLGGFASACYLRGISFVQMPTTLLAAVDSSVGGKTAINLTAGKNLAGAFHQPGLVLMDTDTLDTLTPEVLRDGCGEVLKYGVLRDEELFLRLKEGTSYAKSEECIAKCVEHKKYYVEEDEFDKGLRHFLNLGHTVAHAIEKRSDFGISHGEAVAMGMKIVGKAAVDQGMMAESSYKELSDTMEPFGFGACPYSLKELIPLMYSDKKRTGNSITLVVPQRIGSCTLLEMPVEKLEEFFKQ